MRTAELLKAVANATRLRMVHLLAEHRYNVSELVQILGIRQSRASRHLKILSDAGVLESLREGACCYYALAEQGEAATLANALEPLLEGETQLGEDSIRAEEVRAKRITQTREFFDEIAEDWDRLSNDVLGELDLHGEVARRVGRCGTVADLGCGTGALLSRLTTDSTRVIGVDNSPGMLQLAEDRFSGRSEVSLRLGDLSHLPLRDKEVDGAAMCMVLHHLADPAKALAEAGRIVATGGRLVVADFGRHDNEEMRKAYADLRLGFGTEEMEAMLAASGFNPGSRQDYGVNKGLSVFVYECIKK